MTTHILLGQPLNLFVWDYGRYGTGSAPFNGDVEHIRETWRTVQRHAMIGQSKGTLYAPPAPREVTVLERETLSPTS